MSHKDISKRESTNIISNYIIIYYLNCLLKAETSLRVSSSWQRQAAVNFDVSPKLCDIRIDHMICHSHIWVMGHQKLAEIPEIPTT